MRDVTLGEDARAITLGQGPEDFTHVRNVAAVLQHAPMATLAAATRAFGMNPNAVRAFSHLTKPSRPTNW